MALDGLLAHIDRRVRATTDAVLMGAREQAGLSLERAEHEVRLRVERAVADRRRELEHESRVRIAAAARVLRARVLRARQALIDRVFEQALARASEAACAPVYGQALAEHAADTLDYLDGEAVAVCTPEIVDAVKTALVNAASDSLSDRGGVRVEADPAVEGGTIVCSVDGSVRIDETLAARIDRQRARLSISILERLDELTCGSGGAR